MSDDLLDRLLNWRDNTVVMEVRQTAEDIQKLMTEAAERIEELQQPGSDNYDGPALAQKIMRQDAEIERLRARLEEVAASQIAATREAEALAARMAEAEALLREARASIPGNHSFMLRRIDAFLERQP